MLSLRCAFIFTTLHYPRFIKQVSAEVSMTDEQKKRAAYQDKLKAQLNEWQGEIDKLNAKVEKVEAEAKIEYQKQIDKLKALQDESWDYFEKLRNASERHWDEIKAETELKWTKMNNALKAAFDKLK